MMMQADETTKIINDSSDFNLKIMHGFDINKFDNNVTVNTIKSFLNEYDNKKGFIRQVQEVLGSEMEPISELRKFLDNVGNKKYLTVNEISDFFSILILSYDLPYRGLSYDIFNRLKESIGVDDYCLLECACKIFKALKEKNLLNNTNYTNILNFLKNIENKEALAEISVSEFQSQLELDFYFMHLARNCYINVALIGKEVSWMKAVEFVKSLVLKKFLNLNNFPTICEIYSTERPYNLFKDFVEEFSNNVLSQKIFERFANIILGNNPWAWDHNARETFYGNIDYLKTCGILSESMIIGFLHLSNKNKIYSKPFINNLVKLNNRSIMNMNILNILFDNPELIEPLADGFVRLSNFDICTEVNINSISTNPNAVSKMVNNIISEHLKEATDYNNTVVNQMPITDTWFYLFSVINNDKDKVMLKSTCKTLNETVNKYEISRSGF